MKAPAIRPKRLPGEHGQTKLKDLALSLCFLGPSLIGVLIFFVLPFCVVVYYSVIRNSINPEFVFLDNFIALPARPKAVILGDMLELGPTSDELHAEVVRLVEQGHFEKVYLCGEHFARVGQAFPTFANREALLEALRQSPLKGYHILIKGSHGIGLERCVELL